jgi:hypothetical protein
MSTWSHFIGITSTFTEDIAQGLIASLEDKSTRDTKVAHLIDAGGKLATSEDMLVKALCTYCFTTRHAHSLYLKEHLCFCDGSPRQLKLEMASLIWNKKSLKSGADRRHVLAQMADEFRISK